MEYSSEKRQRRTENKATSLRSGSSRPPYTERNNINERSLSARQSDLSGNTAKRKSVNAERPANAYQNNRSKRRPAENYRRPSNSNTRSSTPAPERSVQKKAAVKRTRKSKSFRKFIIIYGAVLLLILIIGLIIFSSFIGNYEKNQPSNIAKTVVDELSGDKASSFLNDQREFITSIENTDDVINNYLSSISGKELSYVENSDSRADAPSFDIRADGATVGKIYLEQDGTGSFGLKKWKLASLNISEYITDTYSYTILAPPGATVYINGNELPESAITLKDETPEILANAAQFIKAAPKYDSYKAAGLLNVPEVTAKDSSGKDIGVATASEYFVAGGKPDESFIKEQKQFVEDALHDWAYHFIHYQADSTRLSYYVQSGSELYAYIFGSDTMDPIVTTFYDWEYISNVEFTEFEADNYIVYTDDCYSVDVKYKLKVDFNNDKLSDEAQMLDATWVIVKNNNYWGIADVIYHQGTEAGLATPDAETSNDTAAYKETEESTETGEEDTTE